MSWILMKGERSLDCDQGPGNLKLLGCLCTQLHAE